MRVSTYADAHQFLEKTQDYLERAEVVNGLMLGICLRLQQELPQTTPYLATVEDDRGLALVAVMTPPHKLILYSHQDAPAGAVQALIAQLRQSPQTIPAVLGPAQAADSFAERWGPPYVSGMDQRVYELRKVIHPAYPPGSFRLATLADVDVLAQWVLEFSIDIGGQATLTEAYEVAQNRIAQGTLFLWEDQQLVSMAAKTRPTRHGIAVNLVYTPPAARRKGYATACVAKLSQLLLEAGYEFCTLFTDRANPTSNSIYQQIGYVPVCDMNEYRFTARADPVG